VTFEEFLGPPSSTTRANPINDVGETEMRRRLASLLPLERLVEYADGFVFHAGRFDADPMLDAYRRMIDGPHAVVCLAQDVNVGFVYSAHLYLLPEYRCRGLGIELLIQLFLLNGPEVWCSRDRHFTQMGLASYRRAYDELIQRGHI
jgi:GNAT superfamily N-acetyltransferase